MRESSHRIPRIHGIADGLVLIGLPGSRALQPGGESNDRKFHRRLVRAAQLCRGPD